MPVYKLTIEYDGTPYAGWQKQPDRPTVQAAIEAAALKFCGQEIEVVGAGRTDAGVHATGQVAHVQLPKELDPFRVMQGLNFYLFNPASVEAAAQDPVDPALHASHGHRINNRIAIVNAECVSDDFNARFSAKKRHYLYRIVNRRARLGIEAGRAWHVVEPLDEKAMHKAAQALVGHYDFNSFRDTQCQSKTSIKTLEQLDVRRVGEEVRLFVAARSFLHHQVRIMAGTLSLVGKGKWSERDIIAAREALDRTKAGPTAPPEGLYLVGVDY